MENSSALITLKGPIRYQPNHEKPVFHMATLYPQMMYNLSIHNTRRGKMVGSKSHVPMKFHDVNAQICFPQSHIIVNSDLYKYKLMEYDTEYCFSAKTKFLSMPVQCESSAWQCITTPPGRTLGSFRGLRSTSGSRSHEGDVFFDAHSDPMVVQLQRIILSTAIPFVLICALVLIIYLLYRYLNGSGQKTPSLLVM